MSKGTRKKIGQKTRFAVLKRDGFTCQYCGRKPPDIKLQIDHIKPVAEGGSNDTTNLVTACFDCNIGKGPIPLSADHKPAPRKAEPSELAEMWLQRTDGFRLTKTGLQSLRKHLRKYGREEVVEAIKIATDTYLDYGDDEKPTAASVELAWQKVGGILFVRAKSKQRPELPIIYRLRALARTQYGYFDDQRAYRLIADAYAATEDEQKLADAIKDAGNWSSFRVIMEGLAE